MKEKATTTKSKKRAENKVASTPSMKEKATEKKADTDSEQKGVATTSPPDHGPDPDADGAVGGTQRVESKAEGQSEPQSATKSAGQRTPRAAAFQFNFAETDRVLEAIQQITCGQNQIQRTKYPETATNLLGHGPDRKIKGDSAATISVLNRKRPLQDADPVTPNSKRIKL